MITAKCGYEGCDWKEVSAILDLQFKLALDYQNHCIDKHGVKPAIWER